MTTPLAPFNHLSVSGAGERSGVRAVQVGNSFTIQSGQTKLAWWGNPAAQAKASTPKALMVLLPPQTARIDGGEIRFAGLRSAAAESQTDGRPARSPAGNDLFREPMSALNPVLTIGGAAVRTGPIRLPSALRRKPPWQQAIQLLSRGRPRARGDSLGDPLSSPACGRYVARVMIAMALSCAAQTADCRRTHHTAPDVTVQAQILRPAAWTGRGPARMAMMLTLPTTWGDPQTGRAGGGCMPDGSWNKAPPRKCYGIHGTSLHAGADRLPTGAG